MLTRLSIISLLVCYSTLCAQTFKITGIVRDASTMEPLVFASAFVVGTQQGAVTDDRGNFSIDIPSGDYQLQFSYVGYKTSIVPVSVHRDTHFDIALKSIDILLQDMTVYSSQEANGGTQQEVSALSLQSQTISSITSMTADVLRSVQMLPGVSNDNELSAKFNVHGGDFNENLVLVDGMQVYEPYHIKEASNASIGIFDADMIKRMDLMTGGFTARYGDKMSSVLSIDYREGSRDRVQGSASLGMTDADALIEGPIGSNGSFIFGARESYTQLVMRMLNISPGLHISFYDAQGVLAYQLAPQHKLSLLFIRAGDLFRQDPDVDFGNSYTYPFYTSNHAYTGSLTQVWNDTSEQHADYYSSMIALQSTDVISSEAVLKSEISYYDQLESEEAVNQNRYSFLFHSDSLQNDIFYRDTVNRGYDNDLRIKTLEFSSSYDMQMLPIYGIKAGASYQRIFYYQDQVNEQTIAEFTNNGNQYPDTSYTVRGENSISNEFGSIDAQSFKVAGYLENIFQIGEQTILNVGGRVDYFDIDKDLTWSPRINLAYKMTTDLTLRGAWGYYYQSPVYEQLEYSTPSDTNTKSQLAIHYVIGGDYRIISDEEDRDFLTLKVQLYHKTYSDLISSTVSPSGRVYYSRKNDAMGRASGADLFLMYSIPGFSGWISYSYLKADQKLTLNDTLGYYFPRNTDQRHTLAIVADIDLGKAWSMNVRAVYGSGYPYTPMIAVYNQTYDTWTWELGNPNSAYLPAYKRIDARVTKDFTLFDCASSVFLDVSNLFDFTNVQSYDYGFDNNGYPQIRAEKLFPTLPSLGFSVKF
ncbi:MAG TPA: TonB-dependent receptor [Candidatus Acidoferrales bacterium]|nr:TonB-dependent receptor [Candidatus Acidoferrales bacterium]